MGMFASNALRVAQHINDNPTFCDVIERLTLTSLSLNYPTCVQIIKIGTIMNG